MKEFILKRIFIGMIIFSFFIIIIMFGILIHFRRTDDIVLVDDLTCEFRESVSNRDYIKSINGRVLKEELIDTSDIGEKVVQIDYQNQYGYVIRKEFSVKVLDVTSPTVVVNNPYIVEKGSIENLEDTIFCADDYDDDVVCKIDGDYDLNKVGSYELKISAVDFSGNQTERNFVLKVVESNKRTESSNLKVEYTNFSDIYRKYKSENTMIGLDLSKWQGEVDFEKIKKQGVEFVMLKIGGQSKIDGEFVMDPMFLTNIRSAKEYDLKVGVYFYSYATNIGDAVNQARWVVNNLDEYELELPIVFDWENWSRFSMFHISFRTLNKIASSFMKEIENNGYESMLYSSKYYLENIWYHTDYKNWLAYYTDDNDYKGNYLMWQVCSDGKIDGISGYVDIDVMYLNDFIVDVKE